MKPETLYTGAFGEGGRSEVRVRVLAEHGRFKIDLRIFSTLGVHTGRFSPTKEGLAVEVEDLDALLHLLRMAREKIAELEGVHDGR